MAADLTDDKGLGLYYDQDGAPITQTEWIRQFEATEKRILGRTEVGGSRVSTVWLGLNHRFSSDGPPLIFETMVFGGPLTDEMVRYSTREQAIEGHQVMVARVREAQGE